MLKIRAMLGAPPVALSAAMLTLGVVLTFVTQQYGVSGGAAFVLLVPFLFFVFPCALVQAIGNILALWKQLTWWHGLWLLLFLSGLVFRGRDLQSIKETPIDPWAAYRIALLCMTALILLGRLALRQTAWIASLFRGLLGALAIYGLVSLASTVWSVYPAWTFYKTMEYFVDLAVLAAALTTVRSTEMYKSLFDWTWVMLGGLLFTVWAGVILWPGEALVPGGELLRFRIAGVLPRLDQDSVGESAAVLAMVALTRLQFLTPERGGRSFYWTLLTFGLITLVVSQTRAAIVGFIAGVALVWFLSKRIAVSALLASTVVVLLSLTTAGDLLATYWQRGERPEVLQTFSGRLPLWEAAWEKFQQRPVIGYGAYAGARFAVLPKVGDTGLSSLLNSYLEVLVGTGICGLFPILLALTGTWWLLTRTAAESLSRPLERQLATEGLGVLTVITAHSFFSVELMWHPALVFLVILGFAEFLRRSQGYKTTVPAWAVSASHSWR